MDRYTKVVLTVIALALAWLCARPEMPKAQADNGSSILIVGTEVLKKPMAQAEWLQYESKRLSVYAAQGYRLVWVEKNGNAYFQK